VTHSNCSHPPPPPLGLDRQRLPLAAPSAPRQYDAAPPPLPLPPPSPVCKKRNFKKEKK
jgi:hypothetical protein